MRFIFKFLLAFLVAVVFVVGVLFIGALAFKKKILPYSLEQVNSYLINPVSVRSASISVLKDFPNVSIVFHDIVSNNGEQQANLFQFKELSVSFSIINLIRKKYIINSIKLNEGEVRLVANQKGLSFFRETDISNNSDYRVNLPKVIINNVDFEYIDSTSGWLVHFVAKKAKLGAYISNNQNSVQLEFEGEAKRVEQKGIGYLFNEQIAFLVNLSVDQNAYSLQNGMLKIGKSNLAINFKYGRLIESPILILAKGNNIDTRTLTNILAQQKVELPSNFKTRGEIDFSLELSGVNGQTKPLATRVNFRTEALDVAFPKKPIIFLKGLEGQFSNEARGNDETELNIKFKEIRAGNSQMEGVVKLKNPQSPRIYAKLNTSIVLSDINTWWPNLFIATGWVKGNVEFLATVQNPNNYSLADLSSLRGKGNMAFGGVSFGLLENQLMFSGVNGNLSLDGTKLVFSTLMGAVNGSKFDSKIEMPNIFKTIAQRDELNLTGNLQIDSVNTQWFIQPQAPAKKESQSNPFLFEITSDISIQKLKHQGFECFNFFANATVNNSTYRFSNITTNALDGNLLGRIAIEKESEENYSILGELNAKNIEIRTLFKSFNNFGQSEVRDENISGTLTGSATFIAPFYAGKLNSNQLSVVSDIAISNGKLLGLKQLEGLSRFFLLEELNNISFQKMQNTISIESGIVTIPQMDVQSSLLQFTCSGTHSIEGDYFYSMKMNLGDVLFSKAKRSNAGNSEFGQIESDGAGRTPLFVKIVGSAKGQKVSFDTDAAKESTKTVIRNERETLVNALREEFSTIFNKKSDTTKTIRTKFEVDLDEQSKEVKTTDKKIKNKEKEAEKNKTKFTIEWE